MWDAFLWPWHAQIYVVVRDHVRKLSQDTNFARDIFNFEKTFPRDMRNDEKEAFEDGKCIVGKLRAHAFTRNLNNF